MNDVVLHYTGRSGKWQLFVLVVPTIGMFLGGFHNIGISVLAPSSDVDYWCSRPDNLKEVITNEEWKNLSIPFEIRNGRRVFSKCQMYDSNVENIESLRKSGTLLNRTLTTCNSWEYDRSVYTHTIIDKWTLVCDRDILISTSTSIYMAGLTLGVLIFGQVSDTLGRKKTIMISLIISAICSVSIAFSTYFPVFILLRAIVGGTLYGCITTAFCLLMEVSSNDARALYGTLFHFGFAAGMMLLPLIAYTVKNWVYIQFIISTPYLLLIAFVCFLPESPKWLIIKRRYAEAVKIIKLAARLNGRNIPEDSKIEETVARSQNKKLEAGENMEGNIWALYRTPNLRKKTLVIYFQWFVCSFVYHAVSLNTGSLAGNSFINMFTCGAVELPAFFTALFVLLKLGRKIPMAMAQIISGVGCLLVLVAPADMNWLSVTFAMIGKYGTAFGFVVVHVYSSELYPTVVRNIGLGTSSMFARIGSMLSPFIKELELYTNVYVPPVISGLLCFTAAALVMFLPDTFNCHLPQTVEDAESHTT
ncbi:Uncharacterised protein g10929 [Pycnogonum litorale]